MEVAGPHTHVKTHDPRDQQQTEQYGNMDVLYPALIERIGGDVNITEKVVACPSAQLTNFLQDKEPSVLPTAAAVPTVSRNEDSMAVVSPSLFRNSTKTVQCSTQPQPAPVSDRNEAIKRSSRGATRENQVPSIYFHIKDSFRIIFEIPPLLSLFDTLIAARTASSLLPSTSSTAFPAFEKP